MKIKVCWESLQTKDSWYNKELPVERFVKDRYELNQILVDWDLKDSGMFITYYQVIDEN